MHRWRIDPSQYARHEARRGRRHAFEQLDPTTTLLVVVDMVPFFCDENAYTRGIVPGINRLAGALRDAGGTVAWVLPGHEPPTPMRIELYGKAVAATYGHSGGEGPLPDRLWSELDARPEDLFAEKTAASAFFPGRSTLPTHLADEQVDTVLVAGTVANVCCESTVRDASTLGYRTIMVADACSATDDDSLNATLHTVYRSFGDVRATDELIGLIDEGRG